MCACSATSYDSSAHSRDQSPYINEEILFQEELSYNLTVSQQHIPAFDRIEAASRSLSDSALDKIPRPLIDIHFKLQLLYPYNTLEESLLLANIANELTAETFTPKEGEKFELISFTASEKVKGFVEHIFEGLRLVKTNLYVLQQQVGGSHKQHYQATKLGTLKQCVFQFLEKDNKMDEKLKNELMMQEKLKPVKGCVVAKKIFETNSHIILMAPFCNKGTLEREIRISGNIREIRVAHELYFLSGIIAEMHKLKIIHGDLKPDNIMFTRNKRLLEIKVIDFGASRQFGKGVPERPLNGPTLFLPPETLLLRYKWLELKEMEERKSQLKKEGVSKSTLKRYKKRMTRKRHQLKCIQEKISTKVDVYMLGETMFIRNNNGKLPPLQKEYETRIKGGTASTKKQIIDIYLNMTAGSPYKEPSKKKFVEHLIWTMLSPEPKNRPSMSSIHTMIGKKFPSFKMDPLT